MAEWRPGPGWLFCPADRPERYTKALERSDQVVLDLEDAVAPEAKAGARSAVARLADDGVLDLDRTVVRVNAAGTPDHEADVALLDRLGVRRAMLAKSERPDDVDAIGCDVVVLCESPLGVEAAGDLAAAGRTVAVMWGAEDLVVGLGGSSSRRADGAFRDVARFARSRCLVGAKAHGRLALDSVVLDIDDHDTLRTEAEDAAAVGFDAKVAIHPAQVGVIRTAFAPDDAEVAWARRVVDAAASDGGVFRLDGRMVDGPVVLQARRTLARAEAAR